MALSAAALLLCRRGRSAPTSQTECGIDFGAESFIFSLPATVCVSPAPPLALAHAFPGRERAGKRAWSHRGRD